MNKLKSFIDILEEAKWVTQSIIVKKSHPQVNSLEDAKSIAKEFSKSLPTSRETDTSYRFRQRPPEDFSKIETLVIDDHVSLVRGILKK
jgi:hypothetical protein